MCSNVYALHASCICENHVHSQNLAAALLLVGQYLTSSQPQQQLDIYGLTDDNWYTNSCGTYYKAFRNLRPQISEGHMHKCGNSL